jgi:hypothetical protein
MEKLVRRLQADHPGFAFTVGEAHCWSPGLSQIFYAAEDEPGNIAGVLHELGHARLGHQTFVSDMDLLQKEVDAWAEAVRLSERYGIQMDQEHIQNCLDSYRDWLYRRSRCPECRATGIQKTTRRYICLNCQASWNVSGARNRRPYRLQTIKK